MLEDANFAGLGQVQLLADPLHHLLEVPLPALDYNLAVFRCLDRVELRERQELPGWDDVREHLILLF